MPKVTLPPIGNPENSSFVTELNSVLDVLADEFDKVLYRDGSYNITANGLDANSKPLYNLRAPVLAHEPLRLGDVGAFQGTPGVDGEDGEDGQDGLDAQQPNWTHNVATGAPGTSVLLNVTGTYPTQTFNWTIPRGDPGASGALGDGTYSGIVVSGTGSALDVVNNHITFARMADLTGAGVIGGTGAGDPGLLTFATVKSNLALVKGDVGLGNVDNTSDVNKPVSTATTTAITNAVAAGRLLPVTDDADNISVTGSDTEESYRYTGTGGHTATIDNTLAVGALVTIYNDGTGNLAITGSGVTVVNLAAGNTTAFSIPAMSVCTIHKVASGRVLAIPSRTI